MPIRPTDPNDIPALQGVLDSTELFPSEMLPDMIAGFFSGQDRDAMWLTCEDNGTAVGFCYATAEALTDGTWNMLAIAVDGPQQNKGYGRAIVSHLENALAAEGQRVLIADTSGTDAFTNTRRFYEQNGYEQEARIRDFWAAGDDKIVFRKAL